MKKRKKINIFIIITIWTLTALFNIAAWISTSFSDFYVTNIFPYLSAFYGRITSAASFSVGEVMLVMVVIYVAFALVFDIFHGIYFLYKVTPILLTITIVLMSLNCFVLYHTSKLTIAGAETTREYTISDLAELRDYVVEKCNALSEEVPHDENGNVMYEGNMKETAINSMRSLSEDYPRLGGFYVTPKALYFSDFMSQQYMQGYYFPFSMEANYNDVMNLTHKPFTMCHELAHTHGYIYEDEANFFGFLACISSDDIVFQYSGWLGVLNYINNDFYNSVDKVEYSSHVKISDRVKYDNEFLSQEAWDKVEESAIISTETVKKAADTFIDTNLKVNGVSEGKASYSNVVGLIMDYYYNVMIG